MQRCAPRSMWVCGSAFNAALLGQEGEHVGLRAMSCWWGRRGLLTVRPPSHSDKCQVALSQRGPLEKRPNSAPFASAHSVTVWCGVAWPRHAICTAALGARLT
jgi:hypothetical protein